MSTPPHSAPEHSPAQWGTSLGYGEPLTPDEIVAIPMFETVSKGLLQKNQGAVVRRRFKAGETICTEGEFGSTAFYILEGSAEVFLSTPMTGGNVEPERGSWWQRLRAFGEPQKSGRRQPGHWHGFIAIDAPVNLTKESPNAELHAGELFGEMTCMNFYPRSATVRASTDCVVIEMLRNVLDILMKNAKFKAQMDEVYRRRALNDHLRNIPFFADLLHRAQVGQDDIAELLHRIQERAELVRFAPGQVICKQGTAADGFYIVRIGFVRVSKEMAGGEMVVGYLSRGNCFGEMGLLGEGIRTATCTALDHVEMVRIGVEDFQQLLQASPEVRRALEEVAAEREEINVQRLAEVESLPLEAVLTQGLIEAQSLLLLDLTKCTRCDACVKACADTHGGTTRLVREGLRLDHYLVASSCRQCRDPLCMIGCPVGSIRRKRSLEIVIEDWCIGCGLCAKGCPYGNINMQAMIDDAAAAVSAPAEAPAEHAGAPKTENPSAARLKAAPKKKATACDLCSDLDEPSCVYACPHDAAHRVDPRTFFASRPAAPVSTR
jgi:CRP-like cAMP-binding protein/Fe-S-cluster-containing hydrogenase component 2